MYQMKHVVIIAIWQSANFRGPKVIAQVPINLIKLSYLVLGYRFFELDDQIIHSNSEF